MNSRFGLSKLGIEEMFIAKVNLWLLADSQRSPQSPAVDGRTADIRKLLNGRHDHFTLCAVGKTVTG
jgi:hypothetical protein